MDFKLLSKTFEENQDICSQGLLKKYEPDKSRKYKFDKEFTINNLYEKSIIEIMTDHPLDLGLEMLAIDANPVILNICDDCFAGGGSELGFDGYEERLFYRTNYYKTLNYLNGLYPIDDDSNIYSKNVLVFRDVNFNFIDLKLLNFIAVAPIKTPELIDHSFKEFDYDLTLKKLEGAFQTAINKNHDCLILTAFDEKFKNPKNEIINMYNKLIDKYKLCFKWVLFGIPKNKDKLYYSYTNDIIR
jgi:uncharacterized protein (TIGR02452 family)